MATETRTQKRTRKVDGELKVLWDATGSLRTARGALLVTRHADFEKSPFFDRDLPARVRALDEMIQNLLTEMRAKAAADEGCWAAWASTICEAITEYETQKVGV